MSEGNEAAGMAGHAARRAEQARDEAAQARDSAVEARDDAVEAHQRAESARDEAERAAEEGSSRSSMSTMSTMSTPSPPTAHEGDQPARSKFDDSHARPDELLIHPDDEPEPGEERPFGTPGPPVAKHSPFYIGFFGALGALVALFFALAFRHIQSVLVLVLLSAFLAVGLNPIVEVLMHRGIRRRWAVLIVSMGVLSVLTLFVVALVPVLRDQITALIGNAPDWLDKLQRNPTVRDLDKKYDVIDKAKAKLQEGGLAEQIFGSVFAVGLAVLNALFNAFLIFVLTLYFLTALPQIKRACYSLAPASRRQRVTSLGDEVLRRVGGYVAGAFVIAMLAGLSSFVFLEIVGLGQYAVALALVVAILDFIPLIGATIGAVIVSAIGLATSPGVGIACIIFYIVYQQFENYVIYPRVMSSSVDVPGVVTVIAVLIGGSLLGVIGALLAIPTAAAALLIIREVVVPRQDRS